MDGRRGGIRTRDPLHPMQVRYQAALHADKPAIVYRKYHLARLHQVSSIGILYDFLNFRCVQPALACPENAGETTA